MKAPDDLSAATFSWTISSGSWVSSSGGGHQDQHQKEAPTAKSNSSVE